MKKIFLFSLIVSFFSAFSQNLDKDQVYEKYLKNGAFKHSYFDPQYPKYLDSALTYLPKDPFLWQQKAMPLFKRKKYELGLIYLDQAVKYDDRYDTYLSYRAFIKCIFQKNYSGAIADFNVLIKHYNRGFIMDHSYYFYKALSLIQLDKLDEAKENLSISMDLFKNDKIDPHPLELFYMGIIFYEKEDYHKAIYFFDEALKKYPQFSDALYYKGKCDFFLNNFKEALQSFQKSSEAFSKGLTINEDNAMYEDYPYQIKRWMIDSNIAYLIKKQ